MNSDIWLCYYGWFDDRNGKGRYEKPDFLFTIDSQDEEFFTCKTVAGISDPIYQDNNRGYWPGKIFPRIEKKRCRKLTKVEFVTYKLIGPSYFKDKYEKE